MGRESRDSKPAGRGRGSGPGRGRGGRGGRGRNGGRGRGRGRGRGHGGRGRGKTNNSKADANKNEDDKVPIIDQMDNLNLDNTVENKKDSKSARGPKSRKHQIQDGGKQSKNNKKKGNEKNNAQVKNTGDGKSNVGKNKKKENKGPANNKKNHDESRKEKGENKESNKQKQSKQKHTNSNKKKDNQKQQDNLIPSIPPSTPQTTNDLNYKKGEYITVLHIAEKPSIAQSIARGLCRGSFTSISTSLPTHRFENPPFPKAPNASKCIHKVTSVVGHVYNVDFPQSYQSWDTVDPADLFHAPIVRKPCKGSVVKHLSDNAKGVNFIVLWLDCDREGENIAFEVLDCCLDRMEGNSPYDRVYRAYFSAINPSDIQKAYSTLGKPDKNQSLAVDARQELDLKVGVAFSRFQTRYFQGRYGDLDSAVLSYGPCQTPTLGFCVKRHVDIETFKPEPYWLMDLSVYKRGRVLKAQSNAGRSFNQNKINTLIKTVFEASPPATAIVTSVVSKQKKQGRPVPLNTVNLLKACSKALGIGPHSAMQTAERLYLSGYLSYPRTESTAYPKSFDINGSLKTQASDSRWGNYVSELLRTGNYKAKGGVDMGDHPPITPCRAAGPHELSGDMSRVYDLVTRHFIASVSQDAVWQNTKVTIDIEALGPKGNFTIKGKQMISPGFLAVLLHKEYGDEIDELAEYSKEDETEEVQNLPEFKEGETFYLSNPKESSQSKIATVSTGARATLGTKEKMTSPPKHLSESELISLMERNGIGTDASIATHIENICKRNYVELVTGRKLVPSKLGLVLAQGYHLIDSSLVLPQVRADIENECNKVAKGLAAKDAVLKKSIEIFSSKFAKFVEEINKMDVLFSSSFAKIEDLGKPFTRCGFTRRYLQYIVGPPPRLYNKTTEAVWLLPLGGIIREWGGRKCPVEGCGFELCMYSVGNPERSFPLCPNCYNNPRPEWGKIPGEEKEAAEDEIDREDENKERKARSMGGRQFILEAPMPDGHPTMKDLTIGMDPDGDGVLTLDTHFGPKWRVVSSRAPTIYYFPKTAVDKVTVLDKMVEDTDCHMIRIEYKEGQSPLENGLTKQSVSFTADEKVQELCRIYHGRERTHTKGGRGGRGRGRGKGGRGRGRGRGRR